MYEYKKAEVQEFLDSKDNDNRNLIKGLKLRGIEAATNGKRGNNLLFLLDTPIEKKESLNTLEDFLKQEFKLHGNTSIEVFVATFKHFVLGEEADPVLFKENGYYKESVDNNLNKIQQHGFIDGHGMDYYKLVLDNGKAVEHKTTAGFYKAFMVASYINGNVDSFNAVRVSKTKFVMVNVFGRYQEVKQFKKGA